MKSIPLFIALVAVGVMIWYVGMSLTSPRVTHLLSGVATSTAEMVHIEKGDHYTITAYFPDGTPLRTRWNTAADDRARRAIEAWLQDAIAEFKQMINFEDMTTEYRQMIEEMDRQFTYQATYQSYESAQDSLLSYAYTIFIDTGGAHPNTYYHTFVFDRMGTERSIADMFLPDSDYLERLAVEAKSQVTKELKKRLEMEDVSKSIFAEGLAAEERSFENFYIDGLSGQGDTLVLLIPPYQVAAYAAGSFEVRIPLSQMSDILNPEWK